jgi:hypothetical protein
VGPKFDLLLWICLICSSRDSIKLELPHHLYNVVQVVNVAKLRINIIVIVVYPSKQLIHVEEGRHVHVITTAELKWQPHTSDVLTEGAFTIITDNNNNDSDGDEPVHIFCLPQLLVIDLMISETRSLRQ